MNLEAATRSADEIVAAIKPFCEENRCVVAGSVRRKVPQPGDVEIVATPDTTSLEKLHGIRQLLNSGRFGAVETGMFPSRYTRLRGPNCKFDIFWQSRETYGLNLFIRTGPTSYVVRALEFWKKVTNGGYSEGAVLHLPNGNPVPTRREEDVFIEMDEHSLAKSFLDPEWKYVPVRFTDPALRK